ncbi:hypothetical protein N0V90_007835 [Kalmusia sp. IMI 367209]|nr:hypothetical protein N0V90_007835 [Kalmusia sp. IMI 367209]
MPTSPEGSSGGLTYSAVRSRLVPDYESPSCYLPEGCLKELICEDEVQLALEQLDNSSIETTVLTAFVCTKAPRIFTALVWMDEQHLIEVFCRNEFGDSMLPVTEKLDRVLAATTKPGQFEAVEEKRMNKLRSVFGDRMFKQKFRDDFCQKQWAFISPIFTSDEQYYTFDSRHRMPFIEEAPVEEVPVGKAPSERESTFWKISNFSEVKKRLIHRDHLQSEDVQNALAASGESPSAAAKKELPRRPLIHVEPSSVVLDQTQEYHPVIALKKLKKLELNDRDFMEVVQMEADNLKKLQSLNHPHLIKAIAYFKWGETHYFMFPWANLGNLRDYCAMKPPNLTYSYFQWIFHQFCGLADAIDKLHGSEESPES